MDKIEKSRKRQLTQYKTSHLNGSITINITWIHNFKLHIKLSGPSDFTEKLYQSLKEELIPIFYHLFQNI